MGQEAAISFGIMFLCTLLIGAVLYSVSWSTYENIERAEEEEEERDFLQKHTEISLVNASLDPSQTAIHITLQNVGSESIYDITEMDVFTNATLSQNCGVYVNETWVPSSSLGAAIISAGCYWTYSFLGENSQNPLFWDPSEQLNITITFPVSLSAQPYYYVVSTPNAVHTSSIFNTTLS